MCRAQNGLRARSHFQRQQPADYILFTIIRFYRIWHNCQLERYSRRLLYCSSFDRIVRSICYMWVYLSHTTFAVAGARHRRRLLLCPDSRSSFDLIASIVLYIGCLFWQNPARLHRGRVSIGAINHNINISFGRHFACAVKNCVIATVWYRRSVR